MALTKVTGGTISTTSDYQINNLVAVAGTFTGNLNVEGVLTYEDVTNIDAVGLITARKGIHLGAGATVGHLSTVGVSTITSLTVNGTLTAGGDVSIADKIVHTGDTNTAIRFPAADQISFETAGTERIRIHENGTISTNVDNDTYEFTIQGKTGGSPTLWLRDGTTSGTPRVIFGDTNAAAVGAIAYANNGDYMQFKTGGNELVRFTNNSGSAGKVGIGSEIPVSKFDVADGTTGISFDRTNNTPEIHFRSNNVDECGEIRLGESSGGGVMDLRTKTTGGTLTTRLSLHTNGKAAIGDHTPGSHLDIRNSGQVDVLIGSTNAGGVYLMLDGDSNGDGVGADYAYLAHDTGGDLQIGADNPSGNAEIIFKAGNNVEKLRIASDGVVWAKDGKIRLGTTSGTDSYIYSSNAAGIIYQADDNGHKFQTYSGSWQTRLTITDAGKVTIGDAATHTYSAHSEGDDLVVGGSGWRGMTIYGEGGGGVIQFADDGSNRAGQLMYNHGDNSMLFRTNGNTTRFKIGSDGTSTATGTSDGVLQLDTSDSRGAFIRFGQGGSYHHMIGCADGLVAGPDKEDLGLRAADNMVFCTNGATERLRITSGGQVNIGGNYTQTFNALDVTGNIKAFARFNANDAVFIWQQNRMSLGNSFIIESQQNTPFAILTQAVVQPIVFGTNSTERLRIGSDGILTVSSETVIINRNAGDPYLTFQTSGTSNAVIYGGASTGLRGFTKPSGGSLTERVRITPAGQLITGGTATPYPTRSVTIQPVTGQTNTYLSIIAGSTSAVSAITFGDAAGGAAGNYAGMFEYYHSDDSLRYAQNASEKLRITTAGHLEFRNSTTSHQGLKWYKDSGRQVELTYGENNANVVLNIYRQDSQSGFPYGNLIVNTGSSSSPSQAIKVQTDKNIVLTGSLIMGNGQGIDFGNTPDGPNKSSEFLNDYEQGSWTPTNQYQTIQSSRDCRYWKIGHMVTINFDFTAGGSPSGGSQTGGYIESLPFTVHNSSGVGGRPGVIKLYDSYTGAASSLTNTCWMYAGANSTNLYIYHNDDDRVITRGESAGKRIMGTFTYRAA